MSVPYCVFRVLCCRIVANGLTWSTNRRMLAGCKQHKMFSFLITLHLRS